MKVLIAGDFYISDKFQNRDLIDDSVKDLFNSNDFRILNLEAPITNKIKNNKIVKTGPHLQSMPNTVLPFLKSLNIDLVTLANNHILDYGENGLFDTFNTLKNNNINYVGAGKNLLHAKEPYIVKKDDLSVAILNFAENEWSIAENGSAGANPLDIIENVKQIKEAKLLHDKVICIIHGGHEYYNLPSPRMVKQYRFYADNGADAIIGHHTHCISGYEIYKDIPIFYSLGNFIFTLNSKIEDWYTGIIVQLEIVKNKAIAFKYHFVKQHANTFITNFSKKSEINRLIENFEKINNVIINESSLNQCWENYIKKNSNKYFNYISISNIFKFKTIIKLLEKLRIFVLILNKPYLTLLLNIIRNESHLDALRDVIKRKL